MAGCKLQKSARVQPQRFVVTRDDNDDLGHLFSLGWYVGRTGFRGLTDKADPFGGSKRFIKLGMGSLSDFRSGSVTSSGSVKAVPGAVGNSLDLGVKFGVGKNADTHHGRNRTDQFDLVFHRSLAVESIDGIF